MPRKLIEINGKFGRSAILQLGEIDRICGAAICSVQISLGELQFTAAYS
jgi:hypothetical protein